MTYWLTLPDNERSISQSLFSLTHFIPIIFFYNPWNHCKTDVFWWFQGYRRRLVARNGIHLSSWQDKSIATSMSGIFVLKHIFADDFFSETFDHNIQRRFKFSTLQIYNSTMNLKLRVIEVDKCVYDFHKSYTHLSTLITLSFKFIVLL